MRKLMPNHVTEQKLEQFKELYLKLYAKKELHNLCECEITAEGEARAIEQFSQRVFALGPTGFFLVKKVNKAWQMFSATLAEQVTTPATSVYGYCPHCYSPGVSREKRPNGNDTCQAGHTYPSAQAIQTLTQA